MDAFTRTNTIYGSDATFSRNRTHRTGRRDRSSSSSSGLGRRLHRSATESDSLSFGPGNTFFSTYTPEKKKQRKGSASSHASYHSASSSVSSSASTSYGGDDKFCGTMGGGLDGERRSSCGTSTSGSSGHDFHADAGSSGLSPSEHTLLREIGAALTLSFDDTASSGLI